MSGTSMDGIDVALVETDGEGVFQSIDRHFQPYDEVARERVATALADAAGVPDRSVRTAAMAAAETAVTASTVAAVDAFLAGTATDPSAVDVIGMHGQTVFHAPERGITIQLGDAGAVAVRFGVDVVHDFRAADVAAGGEGAPLVPVYHRLVAARAGLLPPVVVANFGGVANLTFVARDGSLLACDTGPAGAMLDDLMRARAGLPFDRDGAVAAAGRPDEAVLARLLAHPFFDRPAPKSLDRNAFDGAVVDALPLAEAAATLLAFAARAFARALALLPERPAAILASGGGARNRALMAAVEAASGVPVVTGEACGIDGDFVEAEAFAYLAVRSLRGLPLTFPGTTGVAAPLTGGVLAPAPGRLRAAAGGAA